MSSGPVNAPTTSSMAPTSDSCDRRHRIDSTLGEVIQDGIEVIMGRESFSHAPMRRWNARILRAAWLARRDSR